MQTLMQLQARYRRQDLRENNQRSQISGLILRSSDSLRERINRKDDLRERIYRLRELELYRLREYKTQSVKTRTQKQSKTSKTFRVRALTSTAKC